MARSGDDCPCRYCTHETGRCSECHARCERYNSWVAKKDEKLKIMREEKEKRLRLHSEYIAKVGSKTVVCSARYRQV